MYTRALTMPFREIKPAMPVVGGGSHPRLVPRIVKDLGIDFVAGVGGAIQAHPQGTTAGVRAMRQALEAAVQDLHWISMPANIPSCSPHWKNGKWNRKKSTDEHTRKIPFVHGI